jgi:alpha-galactosidase
MAFFLQFRRGKEDLYPLIWEALERPEVVAEEPVRTDLMKYFGYFVTESSGHASEYSPYFRKTAAMVAEELVPRFTDPTNHWFDFARTGGYLRHCLHRLEQFQTDYDEIVAGAFPTERSHEYGSRIIEAMETNQPALIAGNVPNTRLIPNLPEGCCVEVPCLVDASGIQPTHVGALPPQLAALNRTNINVQSLIVEAALSGDTDAVYHAVMLDPLTSAVCTLPQIHALVAELLEAQAQWLPQF